MSVRVLRMVCCGYFPVDLSYTFVPPPPCFAAEFHQVRDYIQIERTFSCAIMH